MKVGNGEKEIANPHKKLVSPDGSWEIEGAQTGGDQGTSKVNFNDKLRRVSNLWKDRLEG